MKTLSAMMVATGLLLPLFSSAQVLFQENFENGFALNGWTAESSWITGTSFVLSSVSFPIPAHTVFAGINDDGAGQTALSSGAITSPQIDLTGQTAVILTFDAFFINGDWNGGDETAKVFIRSDTSDAWTLLKSLPGNPIWHTYKLSIPAQFMGDKVRVSFAYDDGAEWNYGFCVDNVTVKTAEEYDCQVEQASVLEYTWLTPRQSRPLVFQNSLNNVGLQSLSGVSMLFRVNVNNTTIYTTTQLFSETAPGETTQSNFTYLPVSQGVYSFRFTASHSELGDNFFIKNYLNAFRLDSAVMAKDDNSAEVYYGMSFGNPEWYGYYGSEFDLIADDTLTGIDVYMRTTSSGSFNLKVAEKDETGAPTVELFHSDNIPIAANFNGWVHFLLPEPVLLDSGNYVFCVGQDTVQGIMGHGFDNSRRNPNAWIISPVAGGGYPWDNYTSNGTLMIRPVFKASSISVSTVEKQPIYDFQIYPNPAVRTLTVTVPEASVNDGFIQVFDAAGRMQYETAAIAFPHTLTLPTMPPGTYLLRLTTKEGSAVRWFVVR